jgi:hypothetical protein
MQDFLFLTIISFLLVIPAFHVCHDLIDCELFSSLPVFEHDHPHEMSAERHEIHHAIGPYVWASIPPGTDFFQQSPHPLFPIISTSQQAPVLRC